MLGYQTSLKKEHLGKSWGIAPIVFPRKERDFVVREGDSLSHNTAGVGNVQVLGGLKS
jgi:hypothetical protein